MMFIFRFLDIFRAGSKKVCLQSSPDWKRHHFISLFFCMLLLPVTKLTSFVAFLWTGLNRSAMILFFSQKIKKEGKAKIYPLKVQQKGPCWL